MRSQGFADKYRQTANLGLFASQFAANSSRMPHFPIEFCPI
jgi:hypothetical protein